MLTSLFPPNTPKLIQKLCYGSLGGIMLIGFVLSAKFLASSFGYFLLHMFYFLFLGLIACVAFVGIWHFCVTMLRKATYQKLDALHAHSGWIPNMGVISDNISPLPSAPDQAMTLFIKVMAEDYESAEQYASKRVMSTLAPRQTASIYASRIRMAAMKGNFDKAHYLYREKSGMMDRAFETEPDLQPEYRDYSDDALHYYQLAAILNTQIGDRERADRYHRFAALQLSKHCKSDQDYYPRLLELAERYAAHDTAGAYALETQLRAEIEPAGASISPGCRADYLRLIAQARLYANFATEQNSIALAERPGPAPVTLQKNLAADVLTSM